MVLKTTILKRVNFVLFFLLSACLVACCPCKRLGTSTNSVTKDSSWTKESKKAMIINVPSKSVDYSFKIECDSITNKPKPIKHQTSGNGIKTTNTIDTTGMMQTYIECLEAKLQIDILERENFKLRTERTTKTELIEVAVSHWYDIAARFLILCLIVIIVLQKFKIL